MLPLFGCGLIASPYALPPGIDAVAAAVAQDRKDCKAGKRSACADYQARIAYCRDEQSKAASDDDTAPKVPNLDPYACVGIDLDALRETGYKRFSAPPEPTNRAKGGA